MGDSVVADNSSVWFPTLEAIQLANWCDGISLSLIRWVYRVSLSYLRLAVAAVALVCYDSGACLPEHTFTFTDQCVLETVLMFPREVSPTTWD